MNKDVQHLLDTMDRSTPAARAAAAEIEAAVASSANLQNLMQQSIAAGHLKSISVAKTDHNGGHYVAKTGTVMVSSDALSIADTQRRGDVLTFVLGHEVGHSFLADYTAKSIADRSSGLNRLVLSGEDRIDITSVLKTYIERSRADEGLAEIAGWNAMRSRVDAERSGPVKAGELAARAASVTSCVEALPGNRYRLDPDVHVDASQRIIVGGNAGQIDAMAQCHFNGGESSLGEKGKSNYTHYYGASAISELSQIRRYYASGTNVPAEIAVDMAALGLTAQGLEDAGLNLGTGATPLTLWNTQGPGHGSPFQLHGTGATGAVVPPRVDGSQLSRDPLLDDIQAGVHRLDKTMGRTPDVTSDRTVASLYALARESGFTRVDHVVLSVAGGSAKAGENIFVVQGGLTEPTNRVAHMKTADAVAAPVEKSMQRAAALEAPAPQQRLQVQEAPAQQHGATPMHHSRF